MSDDSRDRAVDIELLAPEIEALRETALRYTRAVNEEIESGAGRSSETAAIHYVRKLDDELRKAKEVDYVAIVEKEEIKSPRTTDVTFDPKSLDLGRLFADPDMFDSRRTWRRAGFDVLDPAKDTECMVAGHPAAPGCLFKKYVDAVSQKEQSANYAARIEGAVRLAEIIRRERLQHVVVPGKHLHDLPKSFGKSSSVLVVERLDVVGPGESERRYRDIAEVVLRELLHVLVALPGLDSNSKNIQFTRGGKIAFVDLENWGRTDRDKVRLKSIGSYLSKDRLKIARRILDELE